MTFRRDRRTFDERVAILFVDIFYRFRWIMAIKSWGKKSNNVNDYISTVFLILSLSYFDKYVKDLAKRHKIHDLLKKDILTGPEIQISDSF